MEIQNLDGLLLHSDELHKKSENEYTKWLRHRNEIVDIFHEIYWYRKSSSTQSVDLPYIEKGVKEIMFTMYPGEDSPLFPLEYLFKHSARDEFTYRHRWRVGDLIMWDNRCAMHSRDGFDDNHIRLMHRTVLLGDKPF